MWWGVNVLVLLYAFVPVVWIISLSLKDDATLNDGNYLPVSPTGESYAAIFTNPDFLRALINSIGICLIATFDRHRVRHDGRLRHRPARLPGQGGDRGRVAADLDVPADRAGHPAVQDRDGASGCSTPGPA